MMAIAIGSAFAISSCQKSVPEIDLNGTSELLTAYSWKVNYYSENKDENTSELDEYTFTFNDDASLVVTNGHEVYTGTWNVEIGDNHNFGTEVSMFVDGPEEFDAINHDWDISMLTAAGLHLRYNWNLNHQEFYFDPI